jgi:hypothetical protein
MGGKHNIIAYGMGFYGYKRQDPSVAIHNYFREWEKRHLDLKRIKSKSKFQPAICFSRQIGVGVLETADILAKKNPLSSD